MISQLKTAGDPLASEYERASSFAGMAGRMANRASDKGGQFPLLGGGDVNLYSMFVERAQQLVKPDGLIGLLTPSGIAGDLGASRGSDERREFLGRAVRLDVHGDLLAEEVG